MIRRNFCFSTLVVAGALVACSSIPELNFVEDDGGVVLPDGAVVPRDGGDAGIDPNCKKTGAEICDDGIDNDCNGATDCQDTACGAFSCQDAPPGWTAVEFAAAARPTCPASTASNDLRVSAGDGTASCSCSCAGVSGSCTAGSWTVSTGPDITCAQASRAITPLATGGNCTAITGGPFTVSTNVVRTPPSPPASCAPTTTVNGPITNGKVCTPGKFGKGCGTNQVCAPKPPTGAASCVTKPGTDSCPGGFTKRSTAGTAETDARTCTGCNCGTPTPCTGGSISLYEGSMCKINGNGSDRAEPVTATCLPPDPTTGGFVATHFKATAPTGGCSSTPTTPAMPGGTLTFTDQRTVCCK